MNLASSLECPFCIEVVNPKSALHLLSRQWPYSDRLIYRNELVFAVPGFSPQVYPYILVLPQRHTSSMAKTTFYERQSLFKCLQFLIDLLRRNIGADISLYVFEHGGCSNGINKNACLEHAHYHIMVNQPRSFTKL
ncbi:HIT family protein [Longimicrobium sp.]|uniref:HIT family protein n=1 Tax=Longimicrobium sp. TaxID=2029185 RepID=UPI0039C99E75